MAKTMTSRTFDSGTSRDFETTAPASEMQDRIASLGESASRQIGNAPLIALGAGVALGAALGAVLPASRRERELLAPLGSKITDAGYGAVDRAKDMGKQKFDEMAGDKLRDFLGVGAKSEA